MHLLHLSTHFRAATVGTDFGQYSQTQHFTNQSKLARGYHPFWFSKCIRCLQMGRYRKHCISFLMSSTCNLDCTYCYVPHRGNTVDPCDRTIDLEFAVAGTKEFFSWAPKPAIRFFAAGEPTVGFKRMTEIVEEGRKPVGDKLQVELQTNGFFNGTIVRLGRSKRQHPLDLMRRPANASRRAAARGNGRASRPVVEKNIRRFAAHSEMQFGCRATFLNDNFNRQIEVLDYFRSLGVKYVCGGARVFVDGE